jgi:outer membrane protein OmpA-like peptidoglycan-associated protein
MALTFGRSSAVLSAAVLMVLGTTACATKKYVRQTVSPVEARVSSTETKTTEHASAIGALENNVSRADEKATEAGRWAKEAGESANRANEAAGKANEAAGRANETAVQARSRADEAFNRVGSVVENIDNYQLITTETVLFPLGKHQLTREGKEKLDQAVSNIKNSGNYILEVEGFTDPTGSKEANLALSQRRADTVVRYLTTEHQIPLRKIHVIGVGEETAVATEMRTRDARKQARRVEVKVYALNLSGGSQQSAGVSGTSTGSPDMNRTTDTGMTRSTYGTGTRARQMDANQTGVSGSQSGQQTQPSGSTNPQE